MTDVVERLREADPVEPNRWTDSAEGRATRERVFARAAEPRSVQRPLAALVAAAVVLGIVASLLVTRDTAPAPQPAARSFVHGSWEVLPARPGRIQPGDLFWTGNEVIVSGARPAGVASPAAYEPGTRQWRLLDATGGQAPPTTPVWTGTELVYWTDAHEAQWSGVAYNPSRDRWRTIAPAPVVATEHTKAVWNGREVVVVGAMFACPPGANCPTDPTEVAAYDPAADGWRPLPDLPLVLPVEELHNLLAVRDGNGVVVTAQTGAGSFAWRYAPSAGEWVPVPTPPRAGVGVSDLVNAPGRLSYLFWKHVTGTDLRVEVAMLDRGRDAWVAGPPTRVRAICVPRATAVPGGLVVGFVGCPTVLRFFDLRRNEWRTMPRPPKLVGESVWTGEELFGLGIDGRHLLRYRPGR